MDQENINSLIGVDPETVAKLHMYYRSSVIGRRDIGKQLASTIKPLEDFKKNSNFTNRNAEILQAYFKAMGLRIKFLGDYEIPIYTDTIESFEMDNMYYIGTRSDYEDELLREKIRKKYREDVCFVGTNEEFEELLEKEFEYEKLHRDYYCIDIEVEENK